MGVERAVGGGKRCGNVISIASAVILGRTGGKSARVRKLFIY